MNMKEWHCYQWRNRFGQIVRSPLSERDDRLRGRCSGIPECCITFFTEIWMTKQKLFQNIVNHERRMLVDRETFGFRYIPCPDCLDKKHFIKLRYCNGPDCFCGQWKHREAEKIYRKWRRSRKSNRKRRRGF